MLASKNEIVDSSRTKKVCFSIPELSNQLFLLLSDRCQLNCIYCYAASTLSGTDMSYETAKAAIDFLVKNVLLRKRMHGGDVGYITFHGGGEPCINMHLLKLVVEYAEKAFEANGITLVTNILTNGCLIKEDDIRWLAIHINNIQISLDGNQECQDYQRPLRNGKGSYIHVSAMIEQLCRMRKEFSIHTTVTEYNEDSIVAFVEKIKSCYYTCKKLILSPLHSGGRADEGRIGGASAYGELYKRAADVLRDVDISLIGPCIKDGKKKYMTLCDAALFKTVTVAPDGTITFCHETMNKDSFLLGKVTSSGIYFDTKRIMELKNRVVNMEQREQCRKCPVCGECEGGCPVNSETKCELGEILTSF